MDVIEKLLVDLHGSIESRDSYANSVAIISSIESVAFGEIDNLELDICSNLFFTSNNPPSLLEYIVQTTRFKDREVIKAKVSALKFIAQFLKTYPQQGDNHGVIITITLIDTFKKEESGEVKAALLLPLKNLFRCRLLQWSRVGDGDSAFHGPPLHPNSIKLEQTYTALLDELRYGKKVTKGVICESLKLLGILVGCYTLEPSTVQYAPVVINLCNQTLRDNFKASCKDPDFPAIAGSFSCLDRIFFQYEENCENSSELWKYLLQTVQTVNSPDVSKYAAAAKAVRLIKNHASLFQHLIGLNASQSYAIVMAAHKSEKTAVLKHSGDALSALMTQISSYLVEQSLQPTTNAAASIIDALRAISGLLDGYLQVLQDASRTETEDVYLTLKGLMNCASSLPRVHLLGSPKNNYDPLLVIKVIISSARHNELLSAVTASNNSSLEGSSLGSSLTQFSSQKKSLYLGAVISVIFALYLDGIKDSTKQSAFISAITDPSVLSFLDEYVTTTIIGYVKLWKKQQSVVQCTLAKLLFMTFYGHNETNPGLNNAFPRIASRDTIIPLHQLQDCLFKTLLTRTAARKETDESLNVDSTRISEYTGEIDDRLVYGYVSLWIEIIKPSNKAVRLEILQTYGPNVFEPTSARILNLIFQSVLEMIKTLDLNYVKADDLNLQDVSWIPTNIVDQDILININTFFTLFLKQQSKDQVATFFDTFLTDIVLLAGDHPLVSSFYKLLVCIVDYVQEHLRKNGNETLSNFVLELQDKIQNNPVDFRGELLDSTLALILVVPINVVSLEKLVPSLKQSLLTGSNVIFAIQQLTRAVVAGDEPVLSFLPDLIPLTAPYLERFAHGESGKLKTSDTDLKGDDGQALLEGVLLEFLGRIGGMNKLILQNPALAVESSLVWTSSKILDLVVNTSDVDGKALRISVNLDEIFVNVNMLCGTWIVSGKDDQLLISSAEALHSLFILLIGNANIAKNQKSSEHSMFFRNSFPVISKLASKPLRCQKMFEVLLFQTIHWFSGEGNVHDDDSTALLEVLFDSLANEDVDHAERDLASRGLEEYFAWSIKQTSREVKSNVRISAFLSKVITMLSHPLRKYRRGAVIALGKIYKYFREENYLVSRYSMQLLMLLLNASRNGEKENVKDNEQTIYKYEEILALAIAKRGWMNEMISVSEDRVFPTCLNDLVKWLWDNAITAREKSFRRCCMRCFITFSPLLKSGLSTESKQSTLHYLEMWAKDEGHFSVLTGVHSMLFNEFGDKSNITALDVSLDVYTWLLTLELVKAQEFWKMSNKSVNMLDQIPQVLTDLIDTHADKAFISGVNVQLMYRYMIWLQTLLKKSDSMNVQQAVTYLRNKSFWNEDCMALILHHLSVLEVGRKTEGTIEVTFEDYIAAARHLMKFYSSLEQDVSNSLASQNLQEHTVKLLEQSADPTLTDCKELQRTKLILNMVTVNELDIIVFGSNSNQRKQHFIDMIYHRIVREIYSTEDERLIEHLFQLCVDLGLNWSESSEFSPIFSQSTTGASSGSSESSMENIGCKNVCLVHMLKSDCGSILLRKASKILIPTILKIDSNLSFARNVNIITLLDLLPSANAVFLLESVLLEVSSRLSSRLDQNCVDLFWNNILPSLQTFGFHGLTDELLTSLLTIDAEISLLTQGSVSKCSEDFLTFMLKECCDKFHASSKCSVSVLQMRLSWLPYILPGTLSHAPRGLSKRFTFPEETAIESLEEFVSLKFPLDSKELNPTSEQGKDFLALLETYLTSLEQCGSIILLKPLLSSFREGSNHRYYSRLCQAIKSVASNVALPSITDSTNSGNEFSEVGELCNFCIDLILDSLQDFIVKRTFFDLLFLPTLSKMNSKHIAKLFSVSGTGSGLRLSKDQTNQTLVKTMYEIVSKEVSLSIMEDEFEVKGKLYLQIACFRIFGFLYDHCSLADLKSTLTQAYVGSETVSGKELTQALCKIAFKVSKASAGVNDERYKDLLLELQGTAYECLAITVSKTQSDEQFFDTFLFKVKAGEDLWNRVTYSAEVGDSPSYLFAVMSGNFPTKRLGWDKNNLGIDSMADPKMSALRKMATKAKVSAGKGGFLSQYLNNSMLGTSSISQSQSFNVSKNLDQNENGNLGKYSQSQYLDDNLGNEAIITSLKRSYTVAGADDAVALGWDDHVIFLEMNHMNTIPIMGTMVRTITRMSKLFSEKWKASSNIPFWLQEMRTRLTDRGCSQRVRLFALRLLMNQPIAEIVKPWIQELLPSILDCATEELCSTQRANSKDVDHRNFNYFLRDLVFLLCDTWQEAVPNNMTCYQGSKLLNFLLDNVLDDEAAILKENTASFCTLLKHWLSSESSADLYSLSLKAIVEMISMQGSFTGGAHAKASSKGTIAVRARLAGLEILQTLLESGYNILAVEEASLIVSALLGCVKFPRKEIMESSFVVCGLLLQKKSTLESNYRVSSSVKQLMESFQGQLVSAVEQQLSQKFGADLMASSVRSISTTFPKFLSRELVMKTLHCFPQLKFRQRYLYLDALTRTKFEEEDLQVTDLLKPYYKSLLTEVSPVTFGRGSNSIKVPVVQLATIALLTKYYKELSAELVILLIGDSDADGLRLCVNAKSNLQVRDAAYQLLMKILVDHPQLKTESQNGGSWENVKATIYFLLLNGLTDPDDNAMDLEWTSRHEIVHSAVHYEDPKYWNSSTNPDRIGIRRRLLEFFNYDFGLSNVLSNRMLMLMSDFFDPNNSEAWLKYSSFLSLILFVSNSPVVANTPLFNTGLGNTQNSVARDLLDIPQYLGNSTLSSVTPMFALERTTQCLSQLVNSGNRNVFSTQSQAMGINSIMSQGNMMATQSFINRKSDYPNQGGRSMIRGTQQFAWTQTQSQSPSSQRSSAEGPVGFQAFSLNGNNKSAYGTYNWTQSQKSDGNPSKATDSTPSSTPINYNEMPPPQSLPSYIINQRVPTRINPSMVDSEGGKNYAMFRKVQVAKKLRTEEDNLSRRRVTFFRRYKTGELPDICVPLTELVVPLASVCLLHSGLASNVLHALFSSLHANNHDFQQRLLPLISSGFERIKGHSGSSAFVSLFLKQLDSLVNMAGTTAGSISITIKQILDLVGKESLVADLASETGNYYTSLSLLEDLVCTVSKSLANSSTTASGGKESLPASKRKKVVRTKTTTAGSSGSVSGSFEDSDAIANDLFDNGGSSSSNSKMALSQQSGYLVPSEKVSLVPLWAQLLRVYDELQENEIMMSITVKAVSDNSKAQSLKSALDAELRGDYLDAIQIYTSLLEASTGVDDQPKKRSFDQVSSDEPSTVGDTSFERGLWFDRGLSCHHKLADWGKLHDFISSQGLDCVISLKEERDSSMSCKRGRMGGQGQSSMLEEMCSIVPNDRSKSLKERLVPHYFRSLLNVLPSSIGNANVDDFVSNPIMSRIFAFVDKMLTATKNNNGMSSGSGVKSWFEESCSIELAISSVLKSDWSRVKLYSEWAYQDFLRKWSTLHPCALQARQTLLLRLEEILEVRDIATVKADKSLTDESLVRVWSSTEPSLIDPLNHWTNIALIRQTGLALSNPSTYPENNLHMAKLYVRSAVAGVQQGVLTMVKPFLEKNSILRKPVFGKKMVLTMDEVVVVSQYTRKSILRKPLDSSDIPDMFKKAHGLLAKKMELLDDFAATIEESKSNAGNKHLSSSANLLLLNEKYQVLMMQADWSAFAARYEQDKLLCGNTLATTLAGVNEESIKQKKLTAINTYFNALSLVEGQPPGNSSASNRNNNVASSLSIWKEACFSTIAQYADQLLGELEQNQLEMSLNQIQETKNQLETLCVNDERMMDILRSRKKARDGSTFKATEIVAMLTVYLLLKGLKYGSSFCSERILRLVNIVETYSDLLQDYFMHVLKEIPSWVFLRYSAQMLGGLDRPEGKIVVAILESVAQEYPQALYYSYRITSENFGKQGRLLSTKLEKLLANKHVDALIEALTGLTHPELRWSDGMKELEGRCKVYFGEGGSTKLSSKEKTELGNSIVGLFQTIKKMTIEQSWDKVGVKIGRYNMKWAKQIKNEVQSILGKDDNKLLSSKTILEKLKALSNKSDPQLSSGKVDLQEFSTWLLEYSDVNGSKFALELPGQYAKYIKSKPAVDTHEFISSFDSKVLVMASIRKPKRVKIFGHLGNETFFLVKGGEDLRNDERIEQLFMLMNYVLDAKMSPSMVTSNGTGKMKSLEEMMLLGRGMEGDTSSQRGGALVKNQTVPSSNSLAAKTYTVIPMSTKCGMLEWVKNTIPLKSIISEELARDKEFLQANPNCLESENSVDLSNIAAYKERLTWIGSHKTPDYHKCFKSATREQAWNVFSSITAKTPSDLLKRYFKRLAMNAEAFFTLRTEFAKSLAVCSIFGYVLGMGDRHLDNLLIDTKTGSVVQIDFGICFGIGTSMLPVPELIPFRLTPVLRDALQPLDSLALLRQYMVRVLQCLRDDAVGSSGSSQSSSSTAKANNSTYSGVIGNALEIYINDPVIDWLRGITANDKDELEAQREALESSGKATWEPTRRVRMAVRKLKGEDPITLLLEDLKVNTAVTALDSYKALTKILQAVRMNSLVAGGSGVYTIAGSVDSSMSSAAGTSGSIAWGDSMLGGFNPITGESGVNDNDPSRSKSIPVHEQVDLLIKLATDPDVLARQWTGLQTWL